MTKFMINNRDRRIKTDVNLLNRIQGCSLNQPITFKVIVTCVHSRACFCVFGTELPAFSSPEAALRLVSTKNRDLWPGPTAEVRDSLSECSLTNLIGSCLNLLCLQSHSKPESRWIKPEVATLGDDQKERYLWGRE